MPQKKRTSKKTTTSKRQQTPHKSTNRSNTRTKSTLGVEDMFNQLIYGGGGTPNIRSHKKIPNYSYDDYNDAQSRKKARRVDVIKHPILATKEANINRKYTAEIRKNVRALTTKRKSLDRSVENAYAYISALSDSRVKYITLSPDDEALYEDIINGLQELYDIQKDVSNGIHEYAINPSDSKFKEIVDETNDGKEDASKLIKKNQKFAKYLDRKYIKRRKI